jgi:uncharacterized membrane protein YfcA
MNISGRLATMLMVGAQISCVLGIFMCFPIVKIPVEYFITCMAIIIICNYVLIAHKDKYLKYFKEFDKKPRKWKVKWAWISFGFFAFLFGFFVLSALVLNPLLQ